MKHESPEIGGYIGLDKHILPRLHERAIMLNSGRSCLAYLIRAKKIRRIWLPYFLCGSVLQTCQREGVFVQFYHINEDFMPEDVELQEDDWFYLVNYYGQISNENIAIFVQKYQRVLVDATQAYFQMPLEGIDTFYSCRKFFGVPDGGMLYTDTILGEELGQDYSYERMRHLLGSFERGASAFYGDYITNNQLFAQAPVLQMSKLTDNLLRSLDYNHIRQTRTDNFKILDRLLQEKNMLKLKFAEGAYMYPLWVENGEKIRQELIKKKIYVPVLWPDVLKMCDNSMLEYQMAQNILPLPIDQRYGEKEMCYMADYIRTLC